MSLDQLEQLGEFVGGIFVVISLVYVAHQVRRHTRSRQQFGRRGPARRPVQVGAVGLLRIDSPGNHEARSTFETLLVN